MTETTAAAVVVVGSAGVDLVGFSPRMPKPGETISGTGSSSSSAARVPTRRWRRRCARPCGWWPRWAPTRSANRTSITSARWASTRRTSVGRRRRRRASRKSRSAAGENVIIIVPGATGCSRPPTWRRRAAPSTARACSSRSSRSRADDGRRAARPRHRPFDGLQLGARADGAAANPDSSRCATSCAPTRRGGADDGDAHRDARRGRGRRRGASSRWAQSPS